jgi:hypothetical protein
MPEEKAANDVEPLLSEQKMLEDRKQALIDDLFKQRGSALAAFDEKLAKLGYHANSGTPRRSHHRKSAGAVPDAAAKPPVKPKA